MSSRVGHFVVIALFAGAVMLINLGGPRLWDRDEPRNAGCAVEMLARGDWIVPVFNAEQRTHKPVLLYWLIMSSYSVLGVNEFAARLPSALLAIATALCTYEMGRRLFSARAGMWAGVAVATTVMFVVAGRAATPDATLIFCSTLAVTLFVAACFPERRNDSQSAQETDSVFRSPSVPTSWIAAAAIYGSMGLAVLAKGPVGVILPTAVIGMFLLIMRLEPALSDRFAPPWNRLLSRLRVLEPRHFLRTCWSMRPLTALAICLAVAAPWYIWVGVRTDGEFLRSFFLEHNIGRALQTMEGHRGNFLFYPLAILVGFFPWSVFTVPLAIDLSWRFRRHDPWKVGYLFAASWIAVYVTVFSLARTKLPSYVTPCYPALALLTGAFVDRWLTGTFYASRRWQYAAFGVFAVVGLAFAVAIPVAAHQFFPGEEWLGVIGTVPLAAGLFCIWAVYGERQAHAAWCFAGSAAVFLVLVFAIAADRVDRYQVQDRLWAAIDANSAMPRVTAFACLEPSWVFYSGHAIDEISHEQVGPTHSPWINNGDRWSPKNPVSISDLLKGSQDPFVITTGHQLGRVQKLLPADFQVLESVPFFLKDERLVLLGRPKSAAMARRGSGEPRR